jgi:hypothetical protein
MPRLLALTRQRATVGLVAATLLAWLGLFLIGPSFASFLSHWLAGPLQRVGRGKFTDSTAFVLHRLEDSLLLWSSALAIVVAVLLAHRLLTRSTWYAKSAGVGPGLLAFLAINCWLQIAAQTVLFWLPFYDARHIDNYAQFQIKRHLLREQKPKTSVLLIGNSQTRAQIDEGLLNQAWSPSIWTTELTQPGAHGFASMVLTRDLAGVPADYVITYISEIFVYGSENGIVLPKFFQWQDLAYIRQERIWNQLPPGNLRSGIAGWFIPAYRLSGSFSQRLLGAAITDLPQQRFDAARDAQPTAGDRERLQKEEVARFQKRAYETAVQELAGRGTKVILILGRTRPDLHEQVDRRILDDVHEWVMSLRARWPEQVSVIQEEHFFQAQPEDYADKVHVTEEAQTRFSTALVDHLVRTGIITPDAKR